MKSPRPRQVALAAAAMGFASLILILLAVVAGALTVPNAIQLTLLIGIAGVVLYSAFGVRRADAKVMRVDSRIGRQDVRIAELRLRLEEVEGSAREIGKAQDELRSAVSAAIGDDRRETAALNGRISAVEQRISALGQQISGVSDDLMRRLAETGDSLRETRDSVRQMPTRLDSLNKALTGTTDRLYAQLEAFTDLRDLLEPRAPLPRLRGWAASPDVLRLLIGHVAAKRPKLVVECGSGASSVWLGYAVERFGAGRVVALESDERFASITRDLVEAHGLDEIVQVRLAVLEELDGRLWYARSGWEDLKDIDLLFIDGPPGSTAEDARYPALPALLDRCSEDAWIVLDDANRPQEKAISDRWLEENPTLACIDFPAEKGAYVFRRTGDA